jgi:hypothetical protein
MSKQDDKRWRFKPKTVLVGVDDDGEPVTERHGHDSTTYDPDLDWFFGVNDYACGLRSVAEMQREAEAKGEGTRKAKVGPQETGQLIKCASAKTSATTDPDHLAALFDSGALTKGRRIWQKLQRLPAPVRRVLHLVYDARQFFPPELVPPSEDEVRLAHVAYGAAA